MVEDFKLSRFWWNIIAKLQEMFLGFVILFDPNNTRIQLVIFMVIFVCSLLLWARHWPYKLPLLNFMSAVIFGILIVVLLLGTGKLPISNVEENDFSSASLAWLLFGTFAIFLVTLSLVIANLLVKGAHGEMFAFMHLQRVPPVEDLLKAWQAVTQINKKDMQTLVESWEHHERVFLYRVLVQLHLPGLGSRYTNAFRISRRISNHSNDSAEVEAVLERLSTRFSQLGYEEQPPCLLECAKTSDASSIETSEKRPSPLLCTSGSVALSTNCVDACINSATSSKCVDVCVNSASTNDNESSVEPEEVMI